MVGYIRHEFINIIKKLSWMDDSTKEAAIKKAEGLVTHIGYPSELADNIKLEEYYAPLDVESDNLLFNSLRLRKFSVDFAYNRLRLPVNKTDWITHSRPAVVNAFYSPLENSIREFEIYFSNVEKLPIYTHFNLIFYLEFPAGILQYKFFNAENPKYRNYGAIGSVVGHEITHGFDDVGREFDLNGNLADWWDAKTRANFLDKAQCIIEQYGNYTEPKTQLKVSETGILNRSHQSHICLHFS